MKPENVVLAIIYVLDVLTVIFLTLPLHQEITSSWYWFIWGITAIQLFWPPINDTYSHWTQEGRQQLLTELREHFNKDK